jgi:molecular chaperone GrpE
VDRALGWLQLVESFTALRQELKLQTKSARGLDDHVREALGGLETASRQFQMVQAQESQAADRAVQPFIEVLIGLDESLERCGLALEAIQARAAAEGPRQLLATLEGRFQKLSAWSRWWSRRWHAIVLDTCRAEAAASQQLLWHGLLEGFELVRCRLRRAMDEQQLSRIPCLGRMVDANRMTVVELIEAPDAPPESVVAELRPGYTWRDRVVRYAEVRAARPPAKASLLPKIED